MRRNISLGRYTQTVNDIISVPRFHQTLNMNHGHHLTEVVFFIIHTLLTLSIIAVFKKKAHQRYEAYHFDLFYSLQITLQ